MSIFLERSKERSVQCKSDHAIHLTPEPVDPFDDVFELLELFVFIFVSLFLVPSLVDFLLLVELEVFFCCVVEAFSRSEPNLIVNVPVAVSFRSSVVEIVFVCNKKRIDTLNMECIATELTPDAESDDEPLFDDVLDSLEDVPSPEAFLIDKFPFADSLLVTVLL